MNRSAYVLAVFLSILLFITTQGFQCSSPDITSGKLYYSQYEQKKDTTNLNQAFNAFQREVTTRPNSAEGWYWLGLIYGVKKDYIHLSDCWQNSLKISNQMSSEIEKNRMYFWGQAYNTGVSLLQKARATKRDAQFNDARNAFLGAIALQPDSSAKYGAYLNVAVTYLDQQKTEEAVTPLKEAIAKEKSEDAYRILGGYYQRRGDEHKNRYENVNADALAIKAVELRLKKDLPSKEIVELLGEPSAKKTIDKKSEEWRYESKGYLIQFKEGRVASTGYIPGKEPKLDEAEMNLAMKEYDEALRYLQEGNKIHSNSDNIRSALIAVYVAANRSKEALDLFKAEVEKNPNDKIAHYNYGVVLLSSKMYDASITEFAASLKIDPDYENALYNISRAYVNHGVEMREEDQKLNPDAAKQSKEYLKKFEAALPFLEKLVALKPNDVSNWELAGKLYTSTGKVDKAKEAFDKADKLRNGK